MTKGMHQLHVALPKYNLTLFSFQKQFKSKYTNILNILPKRRVLSDLFLLFPFIFFWPEPSRDKKKRWSDSLRKKGFSFTCIFLSHFAWVEVGNKVLSWHIHTFFSFLPVRLRFFSVFVFVHFVVNLIKE